MNQQIEFESDGEIVQGRCRSITRIGKDDYQMGVQRIDAIQGAVQQVESAGWLLAHFVQVQGQAIFCEVLEQVDQENARIQLMDGRQLITAISKIQLLTRDERAVMVQITDQFKKVSGIYQLLDPNLQIDGHGHLVSLEFETWPNSMACQS